MKIFFSNSYKGLNEFLLVASMIGVLLILFTPIPPTTLDFLLLINFCTALMILLITFYTDKPLSFSTFPSLLLMTTLFRLALNISATRLILDDADAGKVIGAVGQQVVGGNYVIGLVVFLILIVVQFVVVTNGAQRVAEVAARFILDSLPGKQMSIDADLNMGIIDQDEAKLRRSELERESNFYGAMDGASKFVKGDAIAGIIIILIDIIGGLTIAIAQKGMEWGEALHLYTLLTVGDGIVTQIPSLIIAVSTGIIITRAATDSRLAEEITRQFAAHPKTLLIVAAALIALGLIPGIPTAPIIIIALVLVLLAWISYRHSASPSPLSKEVAQTEQENVSIYDQLQPQAFSLSLGKELAEHYLNKSGDLEKRVEILKKQFIQEHGIVLPTIAIESAQDIPANNYIVKIAGVSVGGSEIMPEKFLAIQTQSQQIDIEGIPTKEPTYGLDALWIEPELRGQAHAANYTLVEAETVLVTHLQELSKRNIADFITRAETEKLVESRRSSLASLIDELIPAVLTLSDIQKVLQGLVREEVPIKNLETILEVLVDEGRNIKNCDELIEKVREKISASICYALSDTKGVLNVLTLAPTLERKIVGSNNPANTSIGLHPQELEQFTSKVTKEYEKLLNTSAPPVLLCAAPIRRLLKTLLSRTCPQLHVLSTMEVSHFANIVSAGLIEIETYVQPDGKTI